MKRLQTAYDLNSILKKRLKQLGIEGKFSLSQALELLYEHEPEQLGLQFKESYENQVQGH